MQLLIYCRSMVFTLNMSYKYMFLQIYQLEYSYSILAACGYILRKHDICNRRTYYRLARKNATDVYQLYASLCIIEEQESVVYKVQRTMC